MFRNYHKTTVSVKTIKLKKVFRLLNEHYHFFKKPKNITCYQRNLSIKNYIFIFKNVNKYEIILLNVTKILNFIL